MTAQEFIKNQVENFNRHLTSEQFLELVEMENSLVVLEIPFKDYTLTEIARIVENNNAHVMGLLAVPASDGATFLISIKLDISDIMPVLRSFERFNYNVVYYYTREKGDVSAEYEKRLKELLYYLNM